MTRGADGGGASPTLRGCARGGEVDEVYLDVAFLDFGLDYVSG